MAARKTKAKMRRQNGHWVHAGAPVPVTLAPSPWDHGATGPANRIGLVVEERGEKDARTGKVTNPNGVTGVRRVDLLEYWHKRGSISTGGYNAAIKLRDAYEATMRDKPALPGNDRVQSSPKPDQAIAIRMDYISRYVALARKIERQDREIIICCVLDGAHPSRVYGALRTKEGFAHLRDALDRLHSALG